MKTLNRITSTFMIVLVMIVSAANAQQSDLAEIKIKTSATCDMCKETIEKSLAFEKGIKKSVVDVETKMVTVTYNPKKITPEQIRLAISKTGYDADNVTADAKAYRKLDE